MSHPIDNYIDAKKCFKDNNLKCTYNNLNKALGIEKIPNSIKNNLSAIFNENKNIHDIILKLITYNANKV